VLRPVAAEGRNDAEGIVSQARAIGRRSRVRAIQGSTTCATLVVRRACCRASWHPEATCNQPTGGPRKLLALARGPHTPRGERSDARRSIRVLLVGAAALLMMLGPAHAVETVCTGTLPPAGSPYGNVVVPAGQTCAISGIR